MTIKILGPGCPNCKRMEEAALKAVTELGLDAQVEKVTAWEDIMAFGITATPELVVDGMVKSFGRVLSTPEIKKILLGTDEGGFSLKLTL